MVGREEGGERQDNAYFPISGKREGGEEAKCDLLRPGIIYELLFFLPCTFLFGIEVKEKRAPYTDTFLILFAGRVTPSLGSFFSHGLCISHTKLRRTRRRELKRDIEIGAAAAVSVQVCLCTRTERTPSVNNSSPH